jgi:hypothetical protein
VNKLRPGFLDGWTLQRELPYAIAEGPIAPFLHRHTALAATLTGLIANDGAMAVISCLVVAAEALILGGLARPRGRRYAAAAGVVLHGSLGIAMGVITFGLLMVSSYPLFLAAGRRQPSEER